MLKLLKYEFRKTLFPKLILLALTGALEVLFLFGLYGSNDSALSLSIMLLTLTAMCGCVAMGIFSVVCLHRDMNTRQGYMLFMTPHSSYAILGAKVLECCLSLAAAGVFYLALGTLDLSLMMGKYDSLDEMLAYAQRFL